MHRGSLLHYVLGLAKERWLKSGGWMNQSEYNETDHSYSNLPIYYPDFPDHEDMAGPHEG